MADLLQRIMDMAGEKGDLVLQPDLPPRERAYTVVSVDDHLIEPPDTFTGRLPARFRELGPRVERDSEGIDFWIFEDERVPLLGADGIKGWVPGRGYLGPVNFDELNPAVYEIGERVRQMDINGVAASLNFPSAPFGFAGQRFMRMKDQELGLASMRAFNDWIHEVWAGTFPDRIIPCQVTWLSDPMIAAAEIKRNAERGFKAVTFSENPEKLGLPSLYTEHWDPFLRACEETRTVVNLHVGSSSETFVPSVDSPGEVLAALFPINGMAAATDWLYSKVPVRFPEIKIAMSEGGIGWVPMLIDRLEYIGSRHRHREAAFGSDSAADILRRNFWFTTFSDPSSLRLREVVGVENITFETDYPHSDSSWPDTQELLKVQLKDVPAEEAEMMTFRNALELYRHRLPEGW